MTTYCTHNCIHLDAFLTETSARYFKQKYAEDEAAKSTVHTDVSALKGAEGAQVAAEGKNVT